jgi:hypothetical protein
MRLTRSIVLVLSGMVAGLALAMSCGDDSHGKVDAATDAPKADAPAVCDCPPAERPLAGRFVIVSQTQIIAGNATGGQATVCPTGAQVISGSCTTELGNPLRDVTLQQSGFYTDPGGGWHCEFRNNEAIPVTIKVSAICLKPTP